MNHLLARLSVLNLFILLLLSPSVLRSMTLNVHRASDGNIIEYLTENSLVHSSQESNWTICAQEPASFTGSYQFLSDGVQTSLESIAPYCARSDQGWMSLNPIGLSLGNHTITLKKFSQKNGRGQVLESRSIQVQVRNPKIDLQVFASYGELKQVLSSNSLSQNISASPWTICTPTSDQNFGGRMQFYIDGALASNQDSYPYCVKGDDSVQRFPLNLSLGHHSLVAKMISQRGSSGQFISQREIQITIDTTTPVGSPTTPPPSIPLPTRPPVPTPTIPTPPVVPPTAPPVEPTFDPASITFSTTVNAEETMMNTNQRLQSGLTFLGDGAAGYTQIDGKNFLLGAMASGMNLGSNGWSAFTQVIAANDLNIFSQWTKAAMQNPVVKSGPAAYAFDRDYAAGGPAYFDQVSGILFHIYHGEYWPDPNNFYNYYPGLGLAISKDRGVTWNFKKLGQIIATHAPLSKHCTADVGGGTLTKKGDYLYTYYTDIAWVAGQNECWYMDLTVARVKISDLVQAAQNDRVPADGSLFKKYYNGSFTEPGVKNLADFAQGGGLYTPIVERSIEWANFPSVYYSSYIGRFVLAQSVGAGRGIGIRTSLNGIDFTPITYVNHASGSYYPFLLPLSMNANSDLGQEFYVYYTDPFNSSNWSAANLKRVRVKLQRGE